MTQTNLIDAAKLDAHATEKARTAHGLAGDSDFASELSAYSMMLGFFEFNSSATFTSALETVAAGESTQEDLIFEEKLNERDRQFIRDKNLRFNEGIRASQAEKDFLRKDIFNRPEQSKFSLVDDEPDTLSTKAAEVTSKVRESSEASSESAKSKDVNDAPVKASVQGKSNPGTNANGDGKSLKDVPAPILKATQGESAKQLEATLTKGSTKPLLTEQTLGTQPNKAASLGDSNSQNTIDQLKANAVFALSADKGAGLSLPKNPAAQILATPTVIGNASSAASVDGAAVSAVAKTVPVTRSANFDSFLVRQVATKMAVIFKNNVSTVRLTLSPPELGKLRVEIIIENTKVKAMIATENVIVKEVLEANLALLKQSLQDQGLNVTDLNIVLSDGSGNSDKSSGNALSQRGAGRKDGEDQEGPAEKVVPLRTSYNDGLDIFI